MRPGQTTSSERLECGVGNNEMFKISFQMARAGVYFIVPVIMSLGAESESCLGSPPPTQHLQILSKNSNLMEAISQSLVEVHSSLERSLP
jgi:hypothetical protein